VEMMEWWYNLVGIAECISLNNGSETLVLQYEKCGIYSSKSLYAVISYRVVMPVYIHAIWKVVISYRGVMPPVYIPAIWKVGVPSKIQMLLSLLSHNKLMNVDSLTKEGFHKNLYCRFCRGKGVYWALVL
jgi:hypothetical protein